MLFKKSRKIFIHVDCDCFFASCEILKNPNLKGKKVCVWKEIIIACSYEAKAFWIWVWTPIWEAKRILWKNWKFLWIDHNFYSEISDKLMKYLRENTLSIEPFSIDEAFCEITWLAEMYKLSLLDYIKKLQEDIYKKIGIAVSIWVANTRIKSKVYSKINKPCWIYIWYNDDQEKELFKKIPLKDIPYICKSHKQRFKYSCKTVYDYISLWFWKIKKQIGKNWTDLWLELVWVNAFIINKNNEPKSIWRSRSFNSYKNSNYDFLKSQLLTHFERVFQDISKRNYEIKSISVMLRTKSFDTLIYTHKFNDYTNIREEIIKVVINLFEKNFNSIIIYRSTWITFSDFRSYLPRQLSILDKPLRSKENKYKLMKTLESINSKYGWYKISFWIELVWKWDEAKLGFRKYVGVVKSKIF